MTSSDIATFAGQLVALWAIGFMAGTTLTKTKDAINHVS